MADKDQCEKIITMLHVGITLEEVNNCATKSCEYHAEEEIGEGAFGTVFRARRTKDGRQVAIKVCKTDVGFMQMISSTALMQQAVREAKYLDELRHPYVLELLDAYDFTSKNGKKGFALVTEYYAKGNLQQYLKKERPGEEKMLKWYHQLAEAMEYIHSKSATHRDIKPANILIDSNDDMRICDVGLAKVAWEITTSFQGNQDVTYEKYMSSIAGSRLYMAPEVFNKHYPKECDIFSLGLVFVMIAEAPDDELKIRAKYGEATDGLGYILLTHVAARGRRPIDLLELEIKCASKPEQRLFNEMLEFSYEKRPKAAEVLDRIKGLHKERGFKLLEERSAQAATSRALSCC